MREWIFTIGMVGILGIGVWVGCEKIDDENNTPPNPPELVSPLDGAEDQPTRLRLQWQATDPDGDLLQYRIYVDVGIPPQTFWGSTTRTWIDLQGLEYDRTYFWYVEASDNRGGRTSSPTWRFKTNKGTLLYTGRITLPENYYFASESFTIQTSGQFFIDINLQNWPGDYALEVFIMTPEEYERYRQGPDFGVQWRYNLPRADHYKLLTGSFTQGDYYLIIDNTDDGWVETDTDEFNDTGELDIKIYFRAN
ncbi:MAG: fibronectin type III domain-containing protein [bacterium]